MDSEEDAVQTLISLRSKTFNDSAIKARLKSENVLRSFFPVDSTPAPAVASSVYGNGFYGAAGSVGGYYGAYGAPYDAAAMYGNAAMHPEGAKFGRKTNRNRKDRAGKKNKDRKKQDKKAKASADREPVLNAMNFPALPAKTEGAKEAAPKGYAGEFKKYNHDDIMEIVKNMGDDELKLGEGKVDLATHHIAFTETAHPDLLKNQRTYSIDQAREALRQGRPIRSDSVGSLDYDSMMYGEEMAQEVRAARHNKPVAAEAVEGSKSAEPQQEPQPKKGGYAAALINGAAAAPVARPAKAKSVAQDKKSASPNSKTPSKASPVKGKAALSASDDEPRSPWGAKRSFLDVVKTKSDDKPASE